MGSRGAFEDSWTYKNYIGIHQDYREYSSIGTLNHVKIIRWNEGTNNKPITYSNTKNTTYYSYSKENKRIERIYYYRNHKLVRSVDFKGSETPHVHLWDGGSTVGRKTHDPKNVFELNKRDKRLYEAAIKWNKQHG